METKRIELCIPAERNMLLIARMTTSGVVSRAGFTLDEMDDMKMAIDEACNLMMLQKPGCAALKLTYEYDDAAVKVEIDGQDFQEEMNEKTDLNMQEVIRCILETMTDEVTLTERPDGSTQSVCLVKHIPSSRRSVV